MQFDESGASPGFWEGGGPRIFFSDLGILHVAKRHAVHGEAMRIARGGVRGHATRENFLNSAIGCVLGCILIRFCLYFLYKKINILDTHLLWGISREEIFEKPVTIDAFWCILLN